MCRQDVGHALRLPEPGRRDHREGHKGRHRVARQAEERRIAHPAVGKRLARFDGNAPHRQFAEFFERGSHMVFLANGDSPAADDAVRTLGGRRQRRPRRLVVVCHETRVDHLHAERPHETDQRVVVRVVDLARRQRRGRVDEFIAGGDQRHAKRPVHGQSIHANRRGERQILGPQPSSL